MSAKIETQKLTYHYEDGTLALDGLDFTAERGQITGLLGANGAGKSTLFLNLNGILTPESGTVLLDGKPVVYNRRGILALRQRIGIVFQDPDDQLFSADVYRDISFGAVNLGLPAEEVRRRVREAMEQTGIAELSDRPTHALSYGQKKRAAIAGILVMRPDVMILDEPTAGLDPSGVSDIMHLLTRLREELGMTIVVATHDMDMVPLYCDQVYLMNQGICCAHGTPEELFSQPELLRKNHLRLPRIAHLMEILRHRDGLNVNPSAATISQARKQIIHLMKTMI